MNLGRRANFSKKFTLPLRRFSGLCHVVHISRRRGNMATRDRSLKLFNAILGGGGTANQLRKVDTEQQFQSLPLSSPKRRPPPHPLPCIVSHSPLSPSVLLAVVGCVLPPTPARTREHSRRCAGRRIESSSILSARGTGT